MFKDVLQKLKDRKQGMISYLLLKVNEGDWHGVADAAMDLRELETELRVYTELNQGFGDNE